MKVPS